MARTTLEDPVKAASQLWIGDGESAADPRRLGSGVEIYRAACVDADRLAVYGPSGLRMVDVRTDTWVTVAPEIDSGATFAAGDGRVAFVPAGPAPLRIVVLDVSDAG